MNYVVVAYYTLNTPYEEEVKKLQKSLIDFNLPYDLRGTTNLGSWMKNTAFKPKFISQMMQVHPHKDILYLDSDAVVKQHPALFDDFKDDIGVHYCKGVELLSGTIYLRNIERVRQIVDQWIENQTDHVWDQKVLQKILESDTRCRVVDLPSSYTHIFDRMKGEAVIQHNQASRRFKTCVSLSR